MNFRRVNKVKIRAIDAMTIRPFASGPMAEVWTVDLVPDRHSQRVNALPRPVWIPAVTSWVWGFEVAGKAVSLPEMRQVRPGMPIEFEGFVLNAAVVG